ncbi:XRE family transcriptional regulator [Lactobacillus selangorensis]|uniref:XRE family transcriptional regulator n=1 Tax=Lactobacillus selangorensis TaxID=81857 RepID=A0A0R2FXW0_9LACO|nr:helix-turn-helix transcriptional regulator [Lactobacillus selangorensis]KRN28638.1 XRE family transcriptional regulator [Lactobacillus selangorensis]KRN32952.1 XRE family transcriptional regulator [Lactobacillus selangorensis]
MNEKVLGHFLSYKRATLDPADYGITVSAHRRVAGLTREEVAELAHVSTDWYTRIEQGRNGSTPSPEVLASLAKVLHLTPSEQEYVAHLVAKNDLQTTTPENTISQTFLDSQMPTPAFETDHFLTVQKFNHNAQKLYQFEPETSAKERNLFWRAFKIPAFRQQFPDWDDFAYLRTAQFRNVYSTDPDSELLFAIFTDIKDDPVFKKAWNQLKVAGFPAQKWLVKTAANQELYLGETTWQAPDSGHYLFLQTPLDNATRQQLKRL